MRILPTLPPPSICEAILQLCLPHHIPLLVSGGQNIKTMRANFDSDFYSGKYVFLIPSHQPPILKHKAQKIKSLPKKHDLFSSQFVEEVLNTDYGRLPCTKSWPDSCQATTAINDGATMVWKMVPPWYGRMHFTLIESCSTCDTISQYDPMPCPCHKIILTAVILLTITLQPNISSIFDGGTPGSCRR